MNFYLLPLEEVETDPIHNGMKLSQTTIDLCLHALIPAENRDLWLRDLLALTDLEWEKAEDFLTLAIDELTA